MRERGARVGLALFRGEVVILFRSGCIGFEWPFVVPALAGN